MVDRPNLFEDMELYLGSSGDIDKINFGNLEDFEKFGETTAPTEKAQLSEWKFKPVKHSRFFLMYKLDYYMYICGIIVS